jgi:acetyl esterase/lipase
VERDEFKGAPQFFRWLGRNGDGVVTAEEFQKGIQRDGRQWTVRRIPDGVKTLRDLEYANVDGESLRLDLYLPEKSDAKPPLLVWIHGGGWTKGSKSGINPVFVRLTAEGYATASIDYWLEGLTSHPEQIHDCKDEVVPLSQSEHLHKRYQEAGLESSLHELEGAGHGGPQFSDPARYELVKEFLARHIKQASTGGH